MMTMMAVVSSTPVIRGVSGARVIIRIWLRIRVVRPPVVPVGIIIIARRIGIIAARKSYADSPNAGNSGGDLSVRTLSGNKSQSAYRQCNYEKLFHSSPLLFVSVLVCCFARDETAHFPLSWNRMRAVARFPDARYSRIWGKPKMIRK